MNIMTHLRYGNKDLGEPDNAIRAGGRLERMQAELYDMIQELPSVISDVPNYRRLSESPTIIRFRVVAQQYIDRATELSKQYPTSVVIKEYLDDIFGKANVVLDKTKPEPTEAKILAG